MPLSHKPGLKLGALSGDLSVTEHHSPASAPQRLASAGYLKIWRLYHGPIFPQGLLLPTDALCHPMGTVTSPVRSLDWRGTVERAQIRPGQLSMPIATCARLPGMETLRMLRLLAFSRGPWAHPFQKNRKGSLFCSLKDPWGMNTGPCVVCMSCRA